MKNYLLLLPLALISFTFTSCDDDDDNNDPVVPAIQAPDTYSFERNNESTVSYSGQTTRLEQADELYAALNSEGSTAAALDLMFNGSDGSSAGFANDLLNGTSKIIGSKTASSTLAGSATTKERFNQYIADFASNVAPNWNMDAAPGMPGSITSPDGGSTYQINAMGQELDQLFFKGLIGAFTLDQIVNNYIHPNQLDSGTRIDDNDNGVLSDGKPYTDMEHKWDEGFGYLYGQEGDLDDVGATVGSMPAGSGNLLMKYFKKVNDDGGYEPGIGQTVYDAFIMGRTAIVNRDYDLREAQADIIQVELSKVVGYYAIHYLNDYLAKVEEGNVAKAHHSLSEAYGFILSLQFTNNGNDEPYMSKGDVEYFLDTYFADFHNINPIYITASGQGMIDVIKAAYGNTLMID
jgi:hypothetical protein